MSGWGGSAERLWGWGHTHTRNSPICMQISPMAQVALLQTEMNSGLRLVPRIGMNSATGKQGQWQEPPPPHIFLGSPCFAPPLPGVALQPWHLPMQGLTCTKQALVRSPRRAKELCRTSGMVSCGEQAGMGVSTADGCEHRGESRQPPGQDGGGGRGGPSPACTGRAASLCCCEPPAAPRGSQDPRPNHSAGPGPRS